MSDLNKEYKIVNKKPGMLWIKESNFGKRLDYEFYNYKTLEKINKIKENSFGVLKDFVIDKRSEPPIHSKMYTDETGIPIIRVANFSDFNVDMSDCLYLDQKHLDKMNEFVLKENTIVFALVGKVGHGFIVSSNFPKAITYRRVAQIQVENIDPHFLITFINTEYGRGQLERLSTGVNQAQLRLEDACEIIIPIPSSEIQKYIGDKVRKAEKLREEAKKSKRKGEKLLFKYLKIKNLDTSQNSHYFWAEEHLTSNRLDSEYYQPKFVKGLEHLEGLKDEGFSIKMLSDIVEDDSYGILPSSDDYGNGELLYIRSTDLNDYIITDKTDLTKVPYDYMRNKAKVTPGYVVMEIKGNMKEATVIPEDISEAIVNGSIYKFRVKDEINPYYIATYLMSFMSELQKDQHGANSIISYLSKSILNDFLVPIPEKEIQDEIGNKIKKYQEKIYKSKQLIEETKQDVEDLIEGNLEIDN